MKKGKIWGTTETVLSLAHLEIHRIEINPGGYCSWHRHEHKWNAFLVISGQLIIDAEDGTLKTGLAVASGEITTVAPGVRHRFTSTPGAVAYEIYYPRELSEDIIRDTVGGIEEGTTEQ